MSILDVGKYDVEIDFYKIGIKEQIEIKYKEGDINSSSVVIKCTYDGVPVDLSEMSNVLIRIQSGENKIESFPTIVDITNGTIEYTFPVNALLYGVNYFEILLLKESWIKTSPKVYFRVFDSIGEGGGVEEDPTYPILITLLERVDATVIKVDNQVKELESIKTDLLNTDNYLNDQEVIRQTNEQNRKVTFDQLKLDMESAITSIQTTEDTLIENETTRQNSFDSLESDVNDLITILNNTNDTLNLNETNRINIFNSMQTSVQTSLDDMSTLETTLTNNESDRETTFNQLVTNFNNLETTLNNNETTRQNTFDSLETNFNNLETTLNTNETSRTNTFNQLVTNFNNLETTLITNETTRQTTFDTLETNFNNLETTLNTNETNRQTIFDTLETNMQTTISSGENKIVDCENRMQIIEDTFDNLLDGTGLATTVYVDDEISKIIQPKKLEINVLSGDLTLIDGLYEKVIEHNLNVEEFTNIIVKNDNNQYLVFSKEIIDTNNVNIAITDNLNFRVVFYYI